MLPLLPRATRAHLRGIAGPTLAVVLAAGGLAGCGGDESPSADSTAGATPTQSTQPSGDPTDGVPVEGDGYTLLAPPGWADSTDQVRERFARVDAAAADTAVTGGFADNINVIVSDKRRINTQRKAERILRRELGMVGRNVRIQEPDELDGEVAYHATARLEVGRIRVRTSQYFAAHEKKWYLLTFSYGPQTDAETEAEEVQQVLDGWSWQD